MTQTSLNRLSGLAFAIFGVALLLWIIPAHTETVSYGWLRPDTLPKACAWALTGLGLIQSAMPRGVAEVDGYEITVVTVTVLLSAAAIWAFGRVGFLLTAPVFVAVIVALIRERRIWWVVTAVAGAPAITWFFVVFLLGRPLP